MSARWQIDLLANAYAGHSGYFVDPLLCAISVICFSESYISDRAKGIELCRAHGKETPNDSTNNLVISRAAKLPRDNHNYRDDGNDRLQVPHRLSQRLWVPVPSNKTLIAQVRNTSRHESNGPGREQGQRVRKRIASGNFRKEQADEDWHDYYQEHHCRRAKPPAYSLSHEHRITRQGGTARGRPRPVEQHEYRAHHKTYWVDKLRPSLVRDVVEWT